MLIRSRIAQRIFGLEEVLVPAIKLLGLPGVEIAQDAREVTYHHLLFDAHEIILAEGCPTESLYPGPEALKTLSKEAVAELLAIFPDLGNPGSPWRPARHLVKGKQANELVARHVKNARYVLSDLSQELCAS